ncbi:hypothetical protein COCC4DRAFT_122616 [Bipolaris maydis ATCC 48331]|uniref:Carboxylic ester hydrolase n=2 Tax=Cochliobolus heterostrophus TaxID=5016 RepID=M2V854_COCH5|nr:uncharacterized protein COCC4DRAFT_122616 [Bipolaris maydis ATCC 48331]EMD95913.1 hypothetical protein COCHEDRAFT_1210174 [Bipolaris maydis C5]KAH7561803.1 hypothetical protein BM1_02907 [Bipolaris maydis]ENI10772.1 hypothetical protein COCC4DRAFT_122616 [Bipolaris maydis ATCC 48331]KAJ5030622.1 Alpha/Beta hydrolase protein [Bipolaris maydis]KAJ6213305.1 Alpha/Beta hydrolase protein [Bipolaris maydis]
MLRLLLCVAFFLHSALALDEVVDLGYAKYRGKSIGNGVMRWAGMRFARSPSLQEGLRFAAPQDPVKENGTVDASSFGPLCIGTRSVLNSETGGTHAEDCLFVNVFSPGTANDTSNLPVFVFIQGGGFSMNGNANYNGADLIDAADNGMVVVNFNYRVGPYGFLASDEIAADQKFSLNNGLKDQRQALKWVQAHIKQFGGDPNHVTIGGASAGGGSVVFQLTAYGGRDDGLFHAAAAESAAFPSLRDVKDSQWQYNELLRQTGCKDLNCMANMDTVQFQNAVRSLQEPFPGGSGPPIYFWNPTIDGDFIKDFTFNELKAGHYVHVPTIFGTATHDGVIFTPQNVVSLAKAESFLIDNYPGMKWSAISRIWGSETDIAAGNTNGWRAVTADIYGAIRYDCPGLNISATFSSDKEHSTWHYRWNVGAALHVGELLPIWNNATSAAGVFVQAYWASFIRSYDPNKFTAEFLVKKGSELKSPDWKPYDAKDPERLVFNDDNNVAMEKVPEVEQKRCDEVDNLGLHLKQPTANGDNSSPSASPSSPSSPAASTGSSSGSPSSPPAHSYGIRNAPFSLTSLIFASITLASLQWIII